LPEGSHSITLDDMGDDSIQIEYNQDLQALEALLSEVKRPGDFLVSGMREVPMPKVMVEGVGVLSFPVPLAQIEMLIAQATRAPYGRGEETILDESVRKVWQLPPEKVQIGGKSWAANFAGILEQVAAGLGCEGMAVAADLYKLLIYDVGGFFLAHRDTEKVEGMFGTLVLGLPSAYAGGELLIRHAGREARVDLSRAEFSELAFVAFYADCEHEVRPITQGNRVCLVYNLILDRRVKSQGKSLFAPDYEAQISTAASLLKEKLHAPDAPTKVVWLLEHHYSPDGLSFAGLKWADAARANVLTTAAERAGCAAHLCLVHIEESGIAQELYDDYRSRYDDDGDGDTASGDDFEVIEVCDGRHYLSQWRDRSDQPVAFGEVPLAPGELLPAGALDDEEPDEQKLMEASGNEGASFERSYLRAALAVWLRERYTEVLLQAGPDAALPHLRERIDAAMGSSAPVGARIAAVQTARKIVEAWKTLPEYTPAEIQCERRDEMLHLLVHLGDLALLDEFIQGVVTPEYNGDENDALMASSRLLPAARMGLLYSELVRRHMRHLYAPCVDLLHALVSSAQELPKDRAGKAALDQIAGSIVNGLDEVARPAKENEWKESWECKRARPVDTKLVRELMEALGRLGATALCDLAVQHFADRWEIFDPVSVLIPALPLLQEPDAAARRLWDNCAQFVLQRSEHPPEAPRDWRQEANLACSCTDCRELRAFANDPVEQVHRFRLRKDRRQHLHRIIESHGLDMTHETERKGSPQTLVCGKTRETYRRRCEQYRKDIAALETLAQQAGKFGAASEALNRIKAACERKSTWIPLN